MASGEGLKFFESRFEELERKQAGRLEWLFSALPNPNADKFLYDNMLDFWNEQVTAASQFGTHKVLVNWELLHALRWQGSSPCELTCTMKALERLGQLVEKTVYINQGIFIRLGRWLWSMLIKDADELERGDYIVISALQQQADELLAKRQKEMHDPSDYLTTLQLLIQTEANESHLSAVDIELILICLCRAGKCAIEPTDDLDTLIKFQDAKAEKSGQQVVINDTDRKVVGVCKVLNSLRRQIDQLGVKHADETACMQEALKQKNKQKALGHLKQRKILEGIQQQRMNYQQNLDSILLQINEAHTQHEVMAAYRTGITTMKSVAPNVQEVLETTAELQEAFANQNEVAQAMAGISDAINVPIDMSELEAELEELVHEQTSVVGETRTSMKPVLQQAPIIGEPASNIPKSASGTSKTALSEDEELLQLARELGACPEPPQNIVDSQKERKSVAV